MGETRDQRLRRLRRLRRSSRRWSVLSGGLAGAAAVLVPYAGLGLPDAAWAAAAGASLVLAVFRRRDYTALAAAPLPAERPQLGSAGPARAVLRAALDAHPTARAAFGEMSRRTQRRRFRDSGAAEAWARLDAASTTLSDVGGPMAEQVREALEEAAAGERALRDLAGRVLTVERAQRFAAPDTRQSLSDARAMLLTRLEDGVSTFERLVAAAAACAAEHGAAADDLSSIRLADAADQMAAFALSLAELRDGGPPASSAPSSGRPTG